MAGERHGVAIWPGALNVGSCTYTLSHGISPGTAILRILPQDFAPAEVGVLTISDGAETIVLSDCKLDRITIDEDATGRVWVLEIRDRRWKWTGLGQVAGCYNQLDPHGKLIPWTIRSPYELAKLCLDAMGEQGYSIDMPPGLGVADGVAWVSAGNPPWIGVTPTTGTNPPINWEAGQVTPACALAQICDLFGRRVIYRWSSNSVLIAVPGRGGNLPDGSLAQISPSLDAPATPTGIAVAGDPTRYQMRLLLEAVGEEWDGSYRPINQLSYAPDVPQKPQISTATAVGDQTGDIFQVFIGCDPGQPETTGALFEHTTLAAEIPNDIVQDLANKINLSNDARVKGVVDATSRGNVLTVTGTKNGVAFSFAAKLSGSPSATAGITAALTQAAVAKGTPWDYCSVPSFANVKKTDRLTYWEAVAKAKKSVFRYYRIANVDVAQKPPEPEPPPEGAAPAAPKPKPKPKGPGPINVPSYGPIRRRQQLLLHDTQCEQVTPQPRDANLLDSNGQPFTVNFYDGYSRDVPAAVYGAIAVYLQQPWWQNTQQPNTDPKKQIFVDFSIDPVEQLVKFSGYVYQDDQGRSREPRLVLQTAVSVRNSDNNALECYAQSELLPGMKGSTNFAIKKCPDVQLNIVGKYDDKDKLTSFARLENDPVYRARYYLDGMKLQYLLSGGLSATYNGIRALDLDGAIMQATWEVGENGAMTTASRNSEHSIYVPPYPARRRAEFLAPAQQQQIQQGAAPPRIGESLNRPDN